MVVLNVFGNYQPCSVCGNMADDGGLKNDLFTCHDCLDENDMKKSKL